MKKNKIYRIIAIALAISMISVTVGIVSYAAGSNSVETENQGIIESQSIKEVAESVLDDTRNIGKDETVYVLANANGSVKKVIVSDWLKNKNKSATLKDKTTLTSTKVLKGNISYTIDKDNMRTWNADGQDVYYQGESNNVLPVDLSVSYKLDGKNISTEELAGQSGKVTMRFDYKNNQKEKVSIDGVQEDIYVPFVMMTGMVLDNNIFSNIEISNGKLINDGDKSFCLGFALPGMQENLGIEKSEFEIPSYLEITADVKDFALTTTLTVATNDIFNGINLDNMNTMDDLKSKLTELSDASKQLADGSSTLYNGLATLLDKSQELINGINSLYSGADQLKSGTDNINLGSGKLNAGAAQLNAGLKKLASNSNNLNSGAAQVFNTLLTQANTQLSAAGLDVPALSIDNYKETLTQLIQSLDSNTVKDMATATALKKVRETVEANRAAIKMQVTAGVQTGVLEQILTTSGQTMTAQQYQDALNAGIIPAATADFISKTLETQMTSSEVQGQIEAITDSKIEELISANMQSPDVQIQIDEAVTKAANGQSSISDLLGQLNSYNEFYTGLLTYTDGVNTACNGSNELLSGSIELNNGSAALSSGAAELLAGVGNLKNGSGTLTNGVKQLADGAMQLSDGMKKFNEEGISKIVEVLNGNLAKLSTRLRATIDVSKNYTSYSGISDDMDGTVKFIYKTDSIAK